MHKRLQGNGHTEVKVDICQKRPGYLIICPHDIAGGLPEGLPVFLSQTLERWVLDHPECHVRSTQGIVMDGQTVALHVFYDQ